VWDRKLVTSTGHSQINAGKLKMQKKLREAILRREGALTKNEAATFVGAKTLAEFDRWQWSGVVCEPIPGTRLWSRDDLIRNINSLPPASS
jgi:hypothetical protein